VAAHAVGSRAKARATTVGLAGGRRLGLERPYPLVGVRRNRPWLSRIELGMPGKGRGQRDEASASWVIGLERADNAPRVEARDTADPFGDDGSAAASRGSTNCAADPGLETPAMVIQRRRGWPRAEGWAPTQTEARGRSRRAEGESRKPGSGVAPRVLVKTGRLQRLARGISPVERAARRCGCGSAG